MPTKFIVPRSNGVLLFRLQGGVTHGFIIVAMQQIIAGLRHLHSLGILHRDVRAANILVASLQPLQVSGCVRRCVMMVVCRSKLGNCVLLLAVGPCGLRSRSPIVGSGALPRRKCPECSWASRNKSVW
jgi:serine/threonine protein kinase